MLGDKEVTKRVFMFEPCYLSLKGDGLHERRIARELQLNNSLVVASFKVILPPFRDFMRVSNKGSNEKPTSKINGVALPVTWPLYIFGFFYGLLFSILFSLYMFLGKKPFDVIYVRDNPGAFTFNLLKKYHKIPVFFKMQSFTADEVLAGSGSFFANLLTKIMVVIEQQDVWKSDIILVPSNNFKRELMRRYNVDQSKIEVLSVGVDIEKFSKPCLEKGFKSFTLGYFGSLMDINDIDCLLESINYIKTEIDFKLLLSTQSNCSQLVEKIASMSLTNHVEIRRTPYELMPKLINETDVIVVPRRKLSSTDLVLPLKLFEGGAAKKPVIIARTKITETSLRDGTNVLTYEPGNCKNLAEQICKLYYNKDLRQNLGKALFVYVQEYDWAKILDKLNRLILTV